MNFKPTTWLGEWSNWNSWILPEPLKLFKMNNDWRWGNGGGVGRQTSPLLFVTGLMKFWRITKSFQGFLFCIYIDISMEYNTFLINHSSIFSLFLLFPIASENPEFTKSTHQTERRGMDYQTIESPQDNFVKLGRIYRLSIIILPVFSWRPFGGHNMKTWIKGTS